MQVLGEFSTIDTAELALGALFAGNYFGGAVQAQATALAGYDSPAHAKTQTRSAGSWPLSCPRLLPSAFLHAKATLWQLQESQGEPMRAH